MTVYERTVNFYTDVVLKDNLKVSLILERLFLLTDNSTVVNRFSHRYPGGPLLVFCTYHWGFSVGPHPTTPKGFEHVTEVLN